ncbi:1877_t:CDS:2, partial [Ambispora gerdemannii]
MNGYSPNSTEYTQTIPFFICSGQEQACKENCPPGNKDCTDGCTRNCSATDPKKYTATAPTSTFGSSSTPTSSPSGGSILNSAAITNIPMAIINGSFMVFLTVVL